MTSLTRSIASAAAVLCLTSAPAFAQQPQQPSGRFVTVTTFSLSISAAGDTVMMYVDSVMVPLSRVNPNVLSMRVGRHRWGSNGGQVFIMAEYATWEAIGADCGDACRQWEAANQPAPNSPRAAMWRNIQQAFLRAYSGHVDQIYFVPDTRMK